MKKGTEIILFDLGNLKDNEKLCIISDDNTSNIGDLFQKISEERGISVKHFKINPLSIHGEEPPLEVASFMKKSDLILGLTEKSIAHTNARLSAVKNGARFLSLPEFSMDLLNHPSLRTNFQVSAKKAEILSQKFTNGERIEIKTDLGTKLFLDIKNRKGNFAPGYVNSKISLGSPPDIEANVPPNENSSEGIIVVDGSIPIKGIGKLESSITLKIKDGMITSIDGNKKHLDYLNQLFANAGTNSKILAEFGVGFNPNAKIIGNMLVDEGSYGTFHFGFGSNHTIGGKNVINFHLDFVLHAHLMKIDNEIIDIYEIV